MCWVVEDWLVKTNVCSWICLCLWACLLCGTVWNPRIAEKMAQDLCAIVYNLCPEAVTLAPRLVDLWGSNKLLASARHECSIGIWRIDRLTLG